MDDATGEGEARFSAYVEALASVIGHANRQGNCISKESEELDEVSIVPGLSHPLIFHTIANA